MSGMGDSIVNWSHAHLPTVIIMAGTFGYVCAIFNKPKDHKTILLVGTAMAIGYLFV